MAEGDPIWVGAATSVDLPPSQPCNRRPSDVAVALRLSRWDLKGDTSAGAAGGGWSGLIPVFSGLDIVVAVPDHSGNISSLPESEPTAGTPCFPSFVGGDMESVSVASVSASAAAAAAASAAAAAEFFFVRVVVQSTIVKLASGGDYELRTVQLMPVIEVI